jgi:hypothetical protein
MSKPLQHKSPIQYHKEEPDVWTLSLNRHGRLLQPLGLKLSELPFLWQGLGLTVHLVFTASLFRYFIKNIIQDIQISLAIIGNVDKFF